MNLNLLIDLHKDGQRQGPGSDEHTRLALKHADLDRGKNYLLADIGCGTGASTRVLAAELNCTITAVELVPEFTQVLRNSAREMGFSDRLEIHNGSMDQLPFESNSLDIIWSEGAVYNMGFEKGIRYFSNFLKPGGVLGVSEITWLTASRPPELTRFWETEYPEIGTASEKIKVLEVNGFKLLGYFSLPTYCWLENYYEPLESRFDEFLDRHQSGEAHELIESERQEIALYRTHHDWFSYGFYIASKA